MSDLAKLLELHRPYNSPWEVERLAVMPAGHTTWGVLRACLREIATRRDGIREQLVAAEDARRARLWARLALRPRKAAACALRAQEAERKALLLAGHMARLVELAERLRAELPAEIDPAAEEELDRREGLAALEAALRPRIGEAERAAERLPAADVALLGQLTSARPQVPDVSIVAVRPEAARATLQAVRSDLGGAR